MTPEPDGNASLHPPGRGAQDGEPRPSALPLVLVTGVGVLLVLLVLLLWPDRPPQAGDGDDRGAKAGQAGAQGTGNEGTQGVENGDSQGAAGPAAETQRDGDSANPGAATGDASAATAGTAAGADGALVQPTGTPGAALAGTPADGSPHAEPAADPSASVPEPRPGPQKPTHASKEKGADGKPLPPVPQLPPDASLMSDVVKGEEKRPLPQPVRRSVSKEFGARVQRGGNPAAAKRGMTEESEAAVNLGLEWLARQQAGTGEWQGGYEVGVTGLALLAFLGAGHTHKDFGPYKETVRRGLDWLRMDLSRGGEGPKKPPDRDVRPNHGRGLRQAVQPSQPGRFAQMVTFYEQGIATMALCEAYGMTKDRELKEPARIALQCVLNNMGPDGGYGYGGPGDDVHVTSFQVMAIKSGELAKFTVSAESKQKLVAYYDRALRPDGTTGYTSLAQGGGSRTGARTAVNLFSRVFLDCDHKSPECIRIAEVLHQAGPQLGNVFQVYDGTFAMFQMGGKYWKEWNQRFRDGVILLQVKDGPQAGSWPGGRGGTACNTALYIMSLEVYYRYLPVNQ